jgi:rhamnosyltransferase
MTEIKNILAVIVLYNTDYTDSVTLQSMVAATAKLNGQLDVLIYDNSRTSSISTPDFSYKNLNIRYKHDPDNSGVSAAYNYGANYARSLASKQWLLLLDQDTSFEPDILEHYLTAIANYPGIHLFAPILKLKGGIIFSPCKFWFKRGFPLKVVKPGISTLKHISPVNSGMLIGLAHFFEAGMYKEQVKLDFSDFQFIERYKKIASEFCILDTIGYQDFSNDETDVKKLNVRYAYFCDGAKNFEKPIFGDHIQFFIVAFMRAVTLSLRNKRLVFFKTFFNSYLKR